jgi:cytochrome c-type biogenesis protein
MLQFLLALVAGFVTIAGPCIVPLLPIILGTATAKQHPSRPLFIILGFILSFSFFAVVLAVLGSRLPFSADTLRSLAAVLIILFGAVLLFPKIQEKTFAKLQPLLAKAGPRADLTQTGLWSGFLLGASLGLVWTPCAGPVLGSILTLVATKQSLAQAAALLFAYALGAGVPMLAIAYGGQAMMGKVHWIAMHAVAIQRTFGALIILVGLAILTGYDRSAQAWLVIHLPWLFPNLNLNL